MQSERSDHKKRREEGNRMVTVNIININLAPIGTISFKAVPEWVENFLVDSASALSRSHEGKMDP